METEYYIKPDGHAWAICEVKEKGEKAKEPGVYERPFKWYGTLEQACESLLNILAAEKKPTKDIHSLKTVVTEARDEIIKAIKDGKLVR